MILLLETWEQQDMGLFTKDIHPKGGEGGFKIVDENGHGEGGFWVNGCPLFRIFQNLIVSKI